MALAAVATIGIRRVALAAPRKRYIRLARRRKGVRAGRDCPRALTLPPVPSLCAALRRLAWVLDRLWRLSLGRQRSDSSSRARRWPLSLRSQSAKGSEQLANPRCLLAHRVGKPVAGSLMARDDGGYAESK